MRALALLPVWVWLLLFVAAPVALVGVIALATSRAGVPPYAVGLDLGSLAGLADAYYVQALLGSLWMAAATAALTLLIGYPMALGIARSTARPLLLLLVMLPFWSGMLLRLTAWIGILRDEGFLNAFLLLLGLAPLHLLHTDTAMLIGLVSCYLPFMILPVQARLHGADPTLELAAADLGAPPWHVFLRVTLPLSLPGVWAGLALVFIPVTGEYVIPELLGAPQSLTIGRVVWDEFFHSGDWPQAAALCLALLAMLAAPALALRGRARLDIT